MPAGGRFSAMVAFMPSDEERAVLERLAAQGPSRELARQVRGRLALYGLIDETPEGWKITERGHEALATPSRPESHRPPPAGDGDDARPGSTLRRNYGKKTRDTSWFD
jgi:hypothetical protein